MVQNLKLNVFTSEYMSSTINSAFATLIQGKEKHKLLGSEHHYFNKCYILLERTLCMSAKLEMNPVLHISFNCYIILYHILIHLVAY